MNFQSAFFLDIGGIGMSAIARFLKQKNITVAGYDKTSTPLTQQLQKEGILVINEDNIEAIHPFDCVVYTPAIPKDLKLYQETVKSKKPLFKRSQILGEISKNFKTLAVAGTHGKTTTSGMLAHLLKSSSIDCSAFIGGITKNYHSNYLLGNDPVLVVEADEYDRSFLTLFPEYAIITSTDSDHLDIYETQEGFLLGFQQFASQVQKKIFLHEHLKDFTKTLHKPFDFYGITGNSHYHLKLKGSEGLTNFFDYYSPNQVIKDLELHFPGEHNLKNICAAITLALENGASIEGVRKGVKTFQGIQRRLDIQIYQKDLIYIDDYAHHPEEITSLLSAVKKLLPNYHMIAIFQPHLFTRTRDFYKEFAESLSLADEIILLPIYPARELYIPNISSYIIYQQIKQKSKYLITLQEIPQFIPNLIKKPSVILTIGAGDIDTIVEPLKSNLLTLLTQ
jgi:UDP-N-acetylmuramate--alanine ligase